jgi:hypothetical protein
MAAVTVRAATRAISPSIAEVAVERLGGEEHQFVRAGAKRVHARPSLVELQRGVDGGDLEAEARHRVHLILHERDQRRDHQHRALEQTGRQLVGERLPRARRHQGNAILARQHRVDDFALPWTELVKPEDIAEDAFGGA